MHRIHTITFLFAIMCLLDLTGLAQTIEQKKWLTEYSDKETEQWITNRSEAESLAVIYNMPILKQLSDGTIIELQRFENGLPIYDMTDNQSAAATISTRYVHPDGFGGFSLTGSGQILGLWEAGGTPLFTHQEYSGRVTQMDGGGATSDHASHVAGTMIATGINPQAKGMAFLGTINSYTSSNDLGEISSAAANGLKVSNHSYGSIEGWRSDYFGDGKWAWFGDPSISENEDYSFGYYSSTSSTWDQFLYNAPNVLVCKSAGNDRGDGPGPNTEHWVFNGGWVLSNTAREIDGGTDGYDCINDARGIAKNTFTIGAVNDIPNGYSLPSDVIMSSFSNWGPLDDGRIKPDVVANGIGLTSATNTSTTAYTSLSGTSMSTPNVSGSVALLLQQQSILYGTTNPFRSSTMKALIINTADESGLAPGPDYVFGWGLMNTYKAVQLMTLDHETGSNNLIREINLTQGNFSEFQIESNGIEPLKVTICWIDPAGTPPPVSLNPANLMLVNDLDLRVTGPNAMVYQPWVLDPSNPSSFATTGDNFRDNMEQVLIEVPTAGTYTVRINHKGTLSSGSQNFSIVVSGAVVAVPEMISLVEPLNAAQNIFPGEVLFKWDRSTRSMMYQLQISSDSTFATTLIDSILQGVYISLTDLPSLSTVFWRVRASNSGGFGQWSATRYFTTTVALPLTPELLIPEDDAVHQKHNLNFSWSSSQWDSTYRIQIATNQLFTNLVVNDSTLTSNSYQANGLNEGKKYYWKVNAKNSSGTSAFSNRRIFTTKLYPPSNLIASVNSNYDVDLVWADSSLVETFYFVIRRTLTGSFSIIDSIGSNQTAYTDTSVQLGESYVYAVYCKNNLAASDTSNESSVLAVNVENQNELIPIEYSLDQNYPNPFNPSTLIKYSVAQDGFVNVSVFNLIGEKVATLVNNNMKAGSYEVNFDASQLSSGVYFYSIEAGNFKAVRKMMLMK